MPASPPVVQIASLAGQPVGWFVDFGGGKAAEVVCWGLLFDNSGAVPLVFDQPSGKLIPASSLATAGYRLFHSAAPGNPDSFATLFEDEDAPGTSLVASLGGFYSRKSVYVTATAGAVFSAHLEGSADAEHWTTFGTFDKPDIRSEVMLTIHYVRAVLDAVSAGAVTIRMAWSLCGRLRLETGSLPCRRESRRLP